MEIALAIGLAFVTAGVYIFVNLKDYHFLQLELYSINQFYNQTTKSSFTRLILSLVVLVFVLVALVVFYSFVGFLLALLCIVFYIIALLVYFFIAREKQVIIKLKFTPRMIRLVCVNAVLSFLFHAVVYCLVFYMHYLFLLLLTPLVIINIGQLYLAYYMVYPIELIIGQKYIKKAKEKLSGLTNLTVVGITGSYGKTTCKFMLNEMLSGQFVTLCTPNSYNTLMGVVKTINNSLQPHHEVFIVEMGANQVGDILKICKVIKPNAAIITAVGKQHLKTFKSFNNIVKTKYELIENTKEFCVLNEKVHKLYPNPEISAYYVGAADSYCRAENIFASRNGLEFDMVIGAERGHVKTQLLGEHNITNILLSSAMASLLGVPMNKIINVCARLKPVLHRLEQRTGARGEVVLDNTFNSNPQGAESSVNTLKLFHGYTKAVLTPGMVELGEEQYNENFAFGKKLAETADYVYIIKEVNRRAITEGLKAGNFNENRIKTFNSFKEAWQHVQEVVNENWAVLLENDLPDNY